MSIASTTPEAEATGPTFAGDFSLAAVKRLIASCSGLEWSGSTLSSLMHPSEHQQSAEKTDIGGIMRAGQSGDVEVIRLMHAMGVDVSKRTEPLWAEWTPIQQSCGIWQRKLRGVPSPDSKRRSWCSKYSERYSAGAGALRRYVRACGSASSSC